MMRRTVILLSALCFAGDDPTQEPASTIPTTSGGVSTSGGDGTYWYATLETQVDGRLSRWEEISSKDQSRSELATTVTVSAYELAAPLDPEQPEENLVTFRLILTDPEQDVRLKSQVGEHVYLSGIAGWHGDQKYFLVTRHSVSGSRSRGH